MPDSSLGLLVVGPSYFNIYPSQNLDEGFDGYIGGEAAWTAIAAAYAIKHELRERLREARESAEQERSGTVRKRDPELDIEKPQPGTSGSLRADYVKRRGLLKPPREEKSVIAPSVRVEDTLITALTTLSPDHDDSVHRGIRAVFKDCGIRILSSPSGMPVDIHDSHKISEAKVITHIQDDPAFDIREAHRALALGAERAPTVAVFNGLVLGDKKTRNNSLALAQMLRARGTLIFADLRTPMDANTVKAWAKTAHVIKVSGRERKELTGADSGGDAATMLLDAGADFVLITKGNHGANAWWRPGMLTHRALPVTEFYDPEVKFKAGAAFDAGFALALIKFGVNAENLRDKLRSPSLIELIGEDAMKSTTQFLKTANRIIKLNPNRRPIASRPIASGRTANSLVHVIYPELS